MAGKKSKAKALIGDARRMAAERTESAVNKLDDKTGGKATGAIGAGGRLGKGLLDKTNDTARSGVEKGAETDTGAKALIGAKKGLEALSQAPVLSAVGDTVQARHGTTRLAEHVRDHPFDPMPPVWLAEAMLRARREQNQVDVVRTVVNPVRVPVQLAAKAVATANQEPPRVPMITQLLGRAYVLALARLDEELTAPELHALSRVYLARGAPDEAVRLAQGAIAIGGDETAVAAITLARAHGQRRSLSLAREAAELAVASGSTFGHQILAELPGPSTADSTPGTETMTTDQRAELLALVQAEDVVRYRGVAPGATDVVGAVLDRQRDRFKTQSSKLKTAVEGRRKGSNNG